MINQRIGLVGKIYRKPWQVYPSRGGILQTNNFNHFQESNNKGGCGGKPWDLHAFTVILLGFNHRRTMEMGWFEMVDIPMYGNCERRNDDNAWDLGVFF